MLFPIYAWATILLANNQSGFDIAQLPQVAAFGSMPTSPLGTSESN